MGFFAVSLCVKPSIGLTQRPIIQAKPIHFIALAVDIIFALGMLAVGLVSQQTGLLSHHVQFALIGAGAAYTFCMATLIGFLLKVKIKASRHQLL